MNLTEKEQNILLHTLGYKLVVVGGMFEWTKYERNHYCGTTPETIQLVARGLMKQGQMNVVPEPIFVATMDGIKVASELIRSMEIDFYRNHPLSKKQIESKRRYRMWLKHCDSISFHDFLKEKWYEKIS